MSMYEILVAEQYDTVCPDVVISHHFPVNTKYSVCKNRLILIENI